MVRRGRVRGRVWLGEGVRSMRRRTCIGREGVECVDVTVKLRYLTNEKWRVVEKAAYIERRG